MLEITPAVLATLRDKDSKNPEYLQLYQDHDFITAYSLHTDKRIEKDGPELAIGAKKDGAQDWDIHGPQQLSFLKYQGLQPDGKLVDFGCGTGRLAVQAIPYLTKGEYVGLDISRHAICCANEITQGLPGKFAFIWHENGIPGPEVDGADMIWAHSVFTHLPPPIIDNILKALSKYDWGEFCFTCKLADQNQRSGLKQFQLSYAWLKVVAAGYGMKCEQLPWDWPAGQKTMRITR